MIQSLQERIDAVPLWWHSIDLGDGVVTPGAKKPEVLEEEWSTIGLDLRGRSVLDIGAWDGWFSFRAEREGAARVVALDSFVWGRDTDVIAADDAARKAEGLPPRDPHEIPGAVRNYDRLPGRAGFDLAHEALGSRVEPVVLDVTEDDLSSIGTFDVVFFLGVLYHLRDPLMVLTKVAALAEQVVIVETEGIHVPGADGLALAEFAAEDQMSGDPTNWWAPNYDALEGLCRAAGLPHVVCTQAPPFQQPQYTHCRLTVQAWRDEPPAA